jgi:hypothetical protein
MTPPFSSVLVSLVVAESYGAGTSNNDPMVLKEISVTAVVLRRLLVPMPLSALPSDIPPLLVTSTSMVGTLTPFSLLVLPPIMLAHTYDERGTCGPEPEPRNQPVGFGGRSSNQPNPCGERETY